MKFISERIECWVVVEMTPEEADEALTHRRLRDGQGFYYEVVLPIVAELGGTFKVTLKREEGKVFFIDRPIAEFKQP